MAAFRLQVAQRGVVTLPKAVREQYGIDAGDELTLIDLDGVFLLKRGRSQVDLIAEKIERDLAGQGETLESMLAALREIRAEYE